MAASQTEFENGSPNNFFSLVSAGIAKNMVDFDFRKPPRRKLQNQPAPGKGMFKFCITNGEVGKMKILPIKETEQRRGNW